MSISVDAMRAVDKNAGIPLCWLSTVLFRIRDALCPRKPVTPKNVLFIELSEMGSAILVDPVLRIAREKTNIHFVIFRKNKASLDLLKTVKEENIFTISPDSLWTLIRDTMKFLIWCRKKKIDTVVDLELFSRFTALLTGWSGAKNRIGFYRYHTEGLYRGEMLTRKVSYNATIHITKNFLSLIHAVFANEEEVPFSKITSKAEDMELAVAEVSQEKKEAVHHIIARESGLEHLGREILLVNANASELLPQRRWSKDSYARLISKVIQAHPDVLVLLTGAASEREGLEEISQTVDSPLCINMAGKFAFEELTALYQTSKVMVTNDSGPAHFAATVKLPTIVLFGPETPALYHSLGPTQPIYAGLHCSPCVSAANHRKTACSNPVCMSAITVDMVYDVLKGHLTTY